MTVPEEKIKNVRFTDGTAEPKKELLPIKGYADQPLLALDEAVIPIKSLFDDLEAMVVTSKRNSRKPADGLSQDESASIHLYTMQANEQQESVFAKLNKILRSQKRENLKSWFRYLKLLLTALFKLPSTKGTVWRGVKGNVSDEYIDDHVWWGFSSCTESLEVMEQFLGKSEPRTIFSIECFNGKSIRAHSYFEDENEILLMPGTYLRVMGKCNPAEDLYMVQLREATGPHEYLEPPFRLPVTSHHETFVNDSSSKTVVMISKVKTSDMKQFKLDDTYKQLDLKHVLSM